MCVLGCVWVCGRPAQGEYEVQVSSEALSSSRPFQFPHAIVVELAGTLELASIFFTLATADRVQLKKISTIARVLESADICTPPSHVEYLIHNDEGT